MEFTAHMEEDLDHIEEGTEEWVKVLDEFYRPFRSGLKVAEEEMKKVEIEDEVSDEICEKCGRPMVYKMGRFGKFLACSRISGMPQYETDRQGHRRHLSEMSRRTSGRTPE